MSGIRRSKGHSEGQLKKILDELHERYHRKPYLETDPLRYLHRYRRAEDQEIVGFICQSLAYGRVSQMSLAIEEVLSWVGESPYAYIRDLSASKLQGLGASKSREGFVYRFNRFVDIRDLFWILHQMVDRYGSIEGFYLASSAKSGKERISSFSQRALSMVDLPENRPGVSWFFSDPSKGSVCKRLNLFFRWMVRKDEIDLGIWQKISPSELMVPLDTHLIKASQRLGLTKRKTPNWAMVEEVTARLRSICPEDPVKYDFALCREGMLQDKG
jgi:uncharacterized protein (TIGR02757 family)